MPNTSATGGYLTPTTPIQEDATVDAFLQRMVVGVTGLPGTLVRPRWQPVPPKMPEYNVNWCAIGVVREYPCGEPYIFHVSTGDGADEGTRFVDMSVLTSFYGPNARAYANMLRDGLAIEQNREAMFLINWNIKSTDMPSRSVPELLNQQWYNRVDCEIPMIRAVRSIYPVLHFVRAQGIIHHDVAGNSSGMVCS
jgi:hypothetical protein